MSLAAGGSFGVASGNPELLDKLDRVIATLVKVVR
jgi:hypothetical protein